MSGARSFAKQAFAHLANDFFNLYYACHPCNQYKSNRWPSEALLAAGYRFVDLCTESFDDHFESRADGEWVPKTPAGDYTVEKMRLNREHLADVRRRLNALAAAKGLPPIDWKRPARDAIAAILGDAGEP